MADPEKIYPATPHKRNESRKRGQVAKSQDLSAVFNLIGVLMFFLFNKIHRMGPNGICLFGCL